VKGINRMNKIQKVGVMLVAAAVVASTSQVYAMTENWGAATSRFLTGPDGTTGVPSGDLIEIGTVSNPSGAQGATTATQLASFMTVWASSTVGTGEGVDGAWAVTSALPGAGFFGDQIYLLAFNAATPGAATQMGLFTNTGWLFPTSDTAAANSSDIGDAGTTAVVGGLASGTVVNPSAIAGGDAAELKAVPEPSSVVLVVTGLLGLLGIRRRRS
jgi:hypothetical protein